jgi:hypothetical protein
VGGTDSSSHAHLKQIRQGDLQEVLCLREEIKMIRKEIQRAEVRVLAALIAGATVESGPHLVERFGKRRIRILAFRGAILRSEN